MSKSYLSLVMCLLWASPTMAGTDFVARVIMVHEGDRVTISHDGQKAMIALQDIDCPDLKQPYGKQAKRATAAYLANREVVVRNLTRDRQGNMAAEIVLPNGRRIAHELVKEGLAWAQPGAVQDKALKDIEELARASKTGLWSDPNPIPPWKWKPATSTRHR